MNYAMIEFHKIKNSVKAVEVGESHGRGEQWAGHEQQPREWVSGRER